MEKIQSARSITFENKCGLSLGGVVNMQVTAALSGVKRENSLFAPIGNPNGWARDKKRYRGE